MNATETTATQNTPSTAELLEQIRELRAKNRTLTAQNKSLEDSARHYKEMFEHYADMADRATERSEERKDRIAELEAEVTKLETRAENLAEARRESTQHMIDKHERYINKRDDRITELEAQNQSFTAQVATLLDLITKLETQLAEFVGVPANMDLVERAFDQHWRHDGGSCMIEVTAFEAHRPRDLDWDAYLFNGALYYSDGVGAWSIALEYLLD